MADKVVQLTDKDGNNIFPTTQKNITMTDVDPGEGAALAADNYVAVYGGSSSLLDFFYPVGCFFETTDTAFNPNTVWGGTWVEDTEGKVLVAKDTNTFSTVGSTGGSETHSHDDGTLVAGIETFGASRWYFDYAIKSSGTTWTQTDRIYTENSYHEPSFSEPGNGGVAVFGNTGSSSSLQPYMVVKRWHRIA